MVNKSGLLGWLLLEFYTEILGFVKKSGFPAGEFKWITVVSPDESDDIELALEPNENSAAKTFQKEFERLEELGVVFIKEPTKMEWGTFAVFDDTWGNLIQIQEV